MITTVGGDLLELIQNPYMAGERVECKVNGVWKLATALRAQTNTHCRVVPDAFLGKCFRIDKDREDGTYDIQKTN